MLLFYSCKEFFLNSSRNLFLKISLETNKEQSNAKKKTEAVKEVGAVKWSPVQAS